MRVVWSDYFEPRIAVEIGKPNIFVETARRISVYIRIRLLGPARANRAGVFVDKPLIV